MRKGNALWKKLVPALLLAALFFTGCYSEERQPVDFVAIVNGTTYTQEDYDAWYKDASRLEETLDTDLMGMIGMEGSFADEMPLLVFTRYLAICDAEGGTVSEADARAALESLGVEENEQSMRCAVMYETIRRCKEKYVAGVQEDEEGAPAWVVPLPLGKADRPYAAGRREASEPVPEVVVMAIQGSTGFTSGWFLPVRPPT